ncbi:hypothetical protein ACEPAG_7586 [Sanghuangporus baumii]
MAPPPPPPPPPFCLPFGNKKSKRLDRSSMSEKRESWSTHHRDSYTINYSSASSPPSNSIRRSRSAESLDLARRGSYSPTATITSKAENLTFKTDSESYKNLPSARTSSPPPQPRKLGFGFGWALRRQREKELGSKKGLLTRKNSLPPAVGNGTGTLPASGTGSPYADRSANTSELSLVSPSGRPVRPPLSPIPDESSLASSPHIPPAIPPKRSNTQSSKGSGRSGASGQSGQTAVSGRSGQSGGSAGRFFQRRPTMSPTDSQSTLVGSALERKINDVDEIREKVDTTQRLLELRGLMAKENLDYYVVPSEDPHGSEYVAECDRRREFISGFTGSAGQAIISRNSAYLVTDSRYWLQAEDELDSNWNLIRAPFVDGFKDWQSFLLTRVQEGTRIGIDARMISWANASSLNSSVSRVGGKLVFPSQNFVDLVWKNKPPRSKDPIFIQSRRFSGRDVQSKLAALRQWIVDQPSSRPTYAKPGPPTDAQKHVATLVTSLSNIAWLLNLRGHDIPYNPVFHAYLFVGLENAFLFVDLTKLTDDVRNHLTALQVEPKEYNDVWSFLRRASWGQGRVLIARETSYAISLLLTHFRYTIAPSPSYVDEMKAVKNSVEIEGMRRAYLRDGASFVRWLAWLEDKLSKGYEITEYEAAHRLTEYRRKNELYEGLSYEPISATGPNAALPHYKPTKSGSPFIDRDTPYLNDSGAQYRDGTVDCTRTTHFGRPTMEQSEAYTRVLQGHIAIDSAIFPQGTSGRQLDVLARNALWKEGLNYLHGTGHGFGSFLNVHEGPHGFSDETPLVPGHVITNEPGYYADGKFGMRVESGLLVKKVKTRFGAPGQIWLGFERLTVVPIQTKMVRETMLSKDEIAWIKEHNRRCLQLLEPLIRDDKRAVRWLRREAERGIGQASPVPGVGLHIDWD